jgi:DNA-binding NtrC family response regulator
MAAPRVLLIDDDDYVRRALGRSLHDHTVMLSDNAPSALAFLADGGMTYDAIVCDMRMAKMDGPAFYRELLKVRPDLASNVLFITGDADAPKVRSFVAETGRLVLEKPFTSAALKAAIRSVMGPAESGERISCEYAMIMAKTGA